MRGKRGHGGVLSPERVIKGCVEKANANDLILNVSAPCAERGGGTSGTLVRISQLLIFVRGQVPRPHRTCYRPLPASPSTHPACGLQLLGSTQPLKWIVH